MSHRMPHVAPDPGNVNCPICETYNIPGCIRCKRCSEHCNCEFCMSCKVTHPRGPFCQSCGACKRSRACVCHGKAHVLRVADVIRTPSELDRIRPGVLSRPLGVEIELSSHSATLRGNRPVFKHVGVNFVHDGSIHGNNPVEMVVGPVVGGTFRASMDEISKWLTTNDAEANDTCGIHVHVGVTDFGAWELRRLIELYHTCEGHFYSLVAKSRDPIPDLTKKQHSRRMTPAEWEILLRCREAKTSSEIRRAILPAVYIGHDQRSAQACRHQKYQESRYKGFNLHSYYQRGTVEFRMHEGSVDITRISRWMQFCGWFVEFASRLTDAEVAAIHRPEDLFYGAWKRSYGILSFPREVVAYAMAGRAGVEPKTGPHPPPAPPPVAPRVQYAYADRINAPDTREWIQVENTPPPPQATLYNAQVQNDAIANLLRRANQRIMVNQTQPPPAPAGAR